MYMKFDKSSELYGKMINNEQTSSLNMPRGLVAMAHCPLRVSGGILCSERGQSRDAFQAIPLDETSPRCNNVLYYYNIILFLILLIIMSYCMFLHVMMLYFDLMSQYATCATCNRDFSTFGYTISKLKSD